MKTCNSCLVKFPKTEEYFFVKIIRQKLSNGDITVYNSFRSDCKKCHGKKGLKRTHEKKAIKLGISYNEYISNIDTYKSITMTKAKSKHPEACLNLTKGQMIGFRKYINKNNESNHIEYLEYVDKIRKNHIFDVKPKQKYFTKEDIKNANLISMKKGRLKLTDSYICTLLGNGLKVNDVPKQIIETKRISLQIKRLTNDKRTITWKEI